MRPKDSASPVTCSHALITNIIFLPCTPRIASLAFHLTITAHATNESAYPTWICLLVQVLLFFWPKWPCFWPIVSLVNGPLLARCRPIFSATDRPSSPSTIWLLFPATVRLSSPKLSGSHLWPHCQSQRRAATASPAGLPKFGFALHQILALSKLISNFCVAAAQDSYTLHQRIWRPSSRSDCHTGSISAKKNRKKKKSKKKKKIQFISKRKLLTWVWGGLNYFHFFLYK